MCGICGFWSPSLSESDEDLAFTVKRMATALAHRGPDDEGVWTDPEIGLALGHRRLAILDLSEAGHQPMVSPSGRYVLTYNGEIYSFPTIRKHLEPYGYPFRGHSDTEVLLAAIEIWGLPKALEEATGMFAFALWDRKKRLLTLVRDRMGIKPLYYGWNGDLFLFASELKALFAHPAFHPSIDRTSLASFFAYRYVPSPYAIFENIFKLPPGCTLEIQQPCRPSSFDPRPSMGILSPRRYWDLRTLAHEDHASPFTSRFEEAQERLQHCLRDTVECHKIADVPIGVFLSGGIDSSLVTALLQTQSDRPIRTFSIGVNDHRYDEAPYARRVAAHLGTDHTEWYIAEKEALALIPELAHIYDEPFADSSQIPTSLLSRLTRNAVTVALSGDGGDELFAGYRRYYQVDEWESLRRYLPSFFLAGLRLLLDRLSRPPFSSHLEGFLRPLFPADWRLRPLQEMLQKASRIVAASPSEIYRRLVTCWDPEERLVLGIPPFQERMLEPLRGIEGVGKEREIWRGMRLLDAMTYLPDDLLVKVDRASMAVGLEVRVPFLDPRLVTFALALPKSFLIQKGRGKRILREILARYLPPDLIDRPKGGFAIPIGDWIRGVLRPWAEDLLQEDRLRNEGLLDPVPIRRAWEEHRRGIVDHTDRLWSVLMWESWREAFRAVSR